MSVKCVECGEYIETTEIDEFVEKDEKDGINIPVENLPAGTKEIHIFRGGSFENLFIHYKGDAP